MQSVKCVGPRSSELLANIISTRLEGRSRVVISVRGVSREVVASILDSTGISAVIMKRGGIIYIDVLDSEWFRAQLALVEGKCHIRISGTVGDLGFGGAMKPQYLQG